MIGPTTNAIHLKEWELTTYVDVVQLKHKDKKFKHYKEMFKIYNCVIKKVKKVNHYLQ